MKTLQPGLRAELQAYFKARTNFAGGMQKGEEFLRSDEHARLLEKVLRETSLA